MDIFIKAKNPSPSSQNEKILVAEWRWIPVTTIMAIANQRVYEKTGNLPVNRDVFENISGNFGHSIDDAEACKQLGSEMLTLANSPETLEEYGMRVEIQDGNFVYTYPMDFCTAAIELRENAEFVDNIKDHKEEDLISCFWIYEKSLVEISKFIRDSGGISFS